MQIPYSTINSLNMEEIKLSDDVIERIKDSCYWKLTGEQTLLIDKLILNEELKERYKNYGLCEECRQPNTLYSWCQSCNAKQFQQNFKNWTSGNYDIDEFIQNVQLNAKHNSEVLEWIEYDRFENIKYLAKGGFEIVKAIWKEVENIKYLAKGGFEIVKAIWKDGYIVGWNPETNQWSRFGERNVVLKSLHNSQNITVEFLKELFQIDSKYVINYYGITKDPETNNFMIVMNCDYGLCEECLQPYYTTDDTWSSHLSCNAKRFQQNFKNWTSGNYNIDEFIKNAQLNAKNDSEVLEWIEYCRFENIEYLAKGEFGTTYKAIWKDGNIESWESKNTQWKRQNKSTDVALKCLHNSQNEFLKIESHLITNGYYGITKDPETNNFMMVMKYNYSLCYECMNPIGHDTWSHQLCNAERFKQNFKNWTSGNHNIDEFIQNAQFKAKNDCEVLEWIEYDRFENIEYLAEGGFGTVYKAHWKDGYIVSWNPENNQWNKWGEMFVALKCLHNSQNITVEFLKEIETHLITNNSKYVIHYYGITKDPETNNFMMVMKYADDGSLRQYLNNNFNSFDWKTKLDILQRIANGLNSIHDYKLVHRDLHCGNILNALNYFTYITDLGLCQPANVKPSQSDKKIYGVLPYVAPEVLNEKEYTQASDIYGFGIIAYEVCTGFPPYHDMAHEEFLAIGICQGLRPKSNYKIPQLILNIIKQCWDAVSLRRPKAKELNKLLDKLYEDTIYQGDSLINKQIKEADEMNKQFSSTIPLSSTGVLSYVTHSQAIYTSRLLNFKNLPEPKNTDDNDNSLEPEYSDSMAIDFTKLKRQNSEDETDESSKRQKLKKAINRK